jgi:hypothetical protein
LEEGTRRESAAALPTQLHTQDFKRMRDLDEWLLKESGHIKIINVATTKRWGISWGPFGAEKSYTVMYEKLAELAANENKERRQVAYKRFWPWVVLALLARPFL